MPKNPRLLVLLAVLSQACAPAQFRNERAPGYLRCHPHAIEYARLHGAMYRATGCDRSMDFECGVACVATALAESERHAWCAAKADRGRAPDEPFAPGPPADASEPKLGKAAIRNALLASDYDALACFECALQRDAVSLAGGLRIWIQFVINPSGRVVASHARSTEPDEVLASCVAGVVRDTRFPPPPNGGVIFVSYPYVLQMNPD